MIYNIFRMSSECSWNALWTCVVRETFDVTDPSSSFLIQLHPTFAFYSVISHRVSVPLLGLMQHEASLARRRAMRGRAT